jgi:ribosome-associated protein
MSLVVSDDLALPDDDLTFRAVHSGGPGGQHVNKVATKMELRFHLARCTTVPEDVKERFISRYPGAVTAAGDVVLTSARYRTQARNRRDVEDRLAEMIRAVLQPPPPRHPTRVPKSQKQRRLTAKRRRAATKAHRQPPGSDDQ